MRNYCQIMRVVAKTILLVLLLLLCVVEAKAQAIDFALLRSRIYDDLIGYPYDINDPDISTKISSVTTNASNKQVGFIRGDNTRVTLWADLSFSGSADITEAFERLKAMSTAYQQVGSALYHNSALLEDIVSGLSWLYVNKYNENTPFVDNWWDYKIGAPTRLNSILILLKENISGTLFTNLTNAIDYHCAEVGSWTGANLVWIVNVIGTRALLVEDLAKLSYARNALLPALENVTSGDGFYNDGSFLQHTAHPYNGAYGMSHLGTVVQVLYLFSGTALELPQAYFETIMNWVYKGFEPLVFRGALCAFVRGREISRSASTDNKKGRELLQILLRLTRILPEVEYERVASYIKYLLMSDPTYSGYYDGINSISGVIAIQNIMKDATIVPRGMYNMYKQYPNMDRMMAQRENFAFGVSMHSSRIYNFEITNNENLKGWHTGSGMAYLYNKDAAQYDLNFWPTVNAYRLPGTTLPENKTYAKNSYTNEAWVGGVELLGKYGATGMYFYSTTLKAEAKKSWFVFDNEIVCVGSGICSSDATNMNTYIDQRRLITDNRNTLSVNNVTQSATFGSDNAPVTLSNVNWIHLSGKYSSGGHVGYYFPQPATLKAIRQRQTGKWSDINIDGDTSEKSNYFFTLWKEHGNQITADESELTKYSYVLLPEFTKTAVQSYAQNPDIEIMANTNNQHAVRERKLGITAVNFWNNISAQSLNIDGEPYIACNKKASVIVQETNDSIIIGVSDPTQLCTDPVTVKLYSGGATKVLSASSMIEVQSLSSPVTLKVNVSGTRGMTHQIVLFKDATTLLAVEENAGLSSQVVRIGNQIAISVKTQGSGNLSVSLMDLLGRIFSVDNINLTKEVYEFRIPLKSEMSGMCLVLLELKGLKKAHKLFLVR